ncbi:hypothetical protein EX895_003270 [Sporisorium graminicola]|uniref:Uncharacterized protein n=1 Tax=Sporisorium graminicola TaxID=280036 RepID=A0A4V6EU14_9BASI|nr:hypothetical protein EX895_003270 [Sporisorium graminicola]TKY87689.1 hypothetical protein EX895_003270 [Sporisorium graminicola]
MSNSQSGFLPRPSLSHRSISEQPPLYNSASAAHSGPRLRASKAVSGALTATGAKLPYSPLLPLPSATTSKLELSHPQQVDVEQTENVEPFSIAAQHANLASPSALATRRLARQGVSEGSLFHSQQMKPNRSAMPPSAASALGPKATALRVDIAAASDLSGQPAASRSAGMIRSYSLPVATQAEHDEQQRIMALGLSPVSRYAANPSWWQYGWPSPGGINHRHVRHAPVAPLPEFVGQRRRSSQSKLSSSLTPIIDCAADDAAAVSTSVLSSQATSRPSSRSSKTRSSCSPKSKSKHLPSIHQHTFQNASSSSSRRSSVSTSPKPGRSPLSLMSNNLPALDQQQGQAEYLVDEHDDDDDDDDDESVDGAATTPCEAAFDIEMDALNQRFAEWSRSQAMSTPCARAPSHKLGSGSRDESSAHQPQPQPQQQQEDYFNLVHDDQQPDIAFLGVGGGSDTSDEARTPRASSPRPLSKAALYHHEHLLDVNTDSDPAFAQNDRWSGSFDFIHPDHLV